MNFTSNSVSKSGSFITISFFFTLLITTRSFAQQYLPVSLDVKATNELNVKSKKGLAPEDSIYEIQTSGSDPFIYTTTLPRFNPDSFHILSFDYRAPLGLQNFQIYLGPPYSEYRSLKIGKLAPTAEYKRFRINVKNYSGFWNEQVTKLRLDFGNISGGKIDIKNVRITTPLTAEIDNRLESKRKKILSVINETFSSNIVAVKVTMTAVIVTGDVKKGGLYLCELPMSDEPATSYLSFASITPLGSKIGLFEVKKERQTRLKDTSYDRLYSRWVIAEKIGREYKVCSVPHYPDDVYEAAFRYLPEEKPSGKKGLAGFIAAGNTTPDLKELGIKSATVNVVIPSLVSLAPTRYKYEIDRQTVYFDPSALDILDNTIKTCTERNIIVSAVLLIPRGLPKELEKMFVNPASNAGIQSMANLSSITSLNYFRGAMSFLAERYSSPGKEFGRIHHWIVHNEVDMGYDFTNAGNISLENYTDLYDRVLRTTYYTVRQYNSSAKVFLSLTHYWNGSLGGKYFSPRKMLDLFTRLTRQQGDYEWGIAYHPYPQDLFKPNTWNDPDVSNNLLTSNYITPKNIELIDEWMRMESNLFKGLKVRTLLFSEQGIHTPTTSDQDLKLQAAGVAYMWKKFNRLPSLESFCYHRVVDVKSEFGLMLGLRASRPGTDSEPDKPKPSWYLYQKAGTLEEEKAFAFALPIIGVKAWKETFNFLKGSILPITISFRSFKKNSDSENVIIEFNGEKHRLEDGVGTFFSVASSSLQRSYKIWKENKLILEGKTVVEKNKIIDITLP